MTFSIFLRGSNYKKHPISPENYDDNVLQFIATSLNAVYEEQFYLLDLGISFQYSDTLDSLARKELVEYLTEWRKEHKRPTLI